MRYGVAENLVGIDAIRAFRARAGRHGPGARRCCGTVITTYGRDFATARPSSAATAATRVGRQSQTWVRIADGWRVVAAHVSLIAP